MRYVTAIAPRNQELRLQLYKWLSNADYELSKGANVDHVIQNQVLTSLNPRSHGSHLISSVVSEQESGQLPEE